jgi:hypothetical protein
MNSQICVKNSNYLDQNFEGGNSIDLFCGHFINGGVAKI